MKNKILKTIYKLRYGTVVISTINIARYIKKKYSIDMSIDILKKYIVKTFPKCSGNVSLTRYQKRLLTVFYKNFYNKEKALKYFNNKFNKNITYKQYIILMNRYGIKSKRKYPRRIISEKDENEIIEKYINGSTSSELAKEYGYKTNKSITDILKSHNIAPKNYREELSNNVSYCKLSLKKIDSDIKGYFLGLMLTDGWICQSRKYIGLQMTDKDCISFLSDKLKVKYTTIPSRNNSRKKMYRIILYGKDRYNDIQKFGVIPHKSLTLSGPSLNDIPIDILPMVIRGVIDGDGWIRKDGGEFYICSASKQFIDWCNKALKKLNFNSLNIHFKNNEYNGLWYIRTSKKDNIDKLKNIIYKKPYGMMRKYNRTHNIENVQRL